MTFSTHLFSFSELVEDPDVYFMAHENPHLASLKDTIHPKMKGSSILAGNLGRHVFGVRYPMTVLTGVHFLVHSAQVACAVTVLTGVHSPSLYVLVSCGSVNRSPLLDSCFADILKMLTGVHSLTLDVLVS